jgi:protein O-mannosyl-transferase
VTTRRLGLLLFLVTVLVHAPSLANGFAYDDVVIIKGDKRVTEFQLDSILAKPYWTTPGFALYRPLVTLSFAADWQLANGAAWWFHAVNVLWNALATLALFVLLLAWFQPKWSAAGALLYGLHPVHVEAVANVVGRAELMAATFALMACAAWAHQWPRNRAGRFAFAALCFAIALLCKESSIVLPGLLVLIDAANAKWRSLRELPAYILRTLPELTGFSALIAGSFVMRARFAGGLTPTQLDPIIEVITAPDQRILTALQVWPTMALLFVLPWRLLSDYGPRVFMPAEGLPVETVLGFAIVAALLIGGLLALHRGRGLLALGLLWVPITFLPVANFIVPIGVLLAERTLYMPSAVLALAIAAGAQHFTDRGGSARRLALGVALVALLFAARSVIRMPDWASTDSIMMAQLRDYPDSFRAEWHKARMERRDGRPQSALLHYTRAVELWPYRQRLIIEAAAFAGTQNQGQAAYRLAKHGVQRWPENFQLQRLLAAHAMDVGDTATARVAVKEALRMSPRDPLLRKISDALGAHPR